MRSEELLEFVQPATEEPMRVQRKRSPRYCVISRRLMQKASNGAHDFVASWPWRAMARFSRRSKELSKGESPNSRTAYTDSATTRSLFQMGSNKLLANCPEK